MLTTKLAHRLYHDATVVDYNLFINFFDIGDVKYTAHARLQRLKIIVLHNSEQVQTSTAHM